MATQHIADLEDTFRRASISTVIGDSCREGYKILTGRQDQGTADNPIRHHSYGMRDGIDFAANDVEDRREIPTGRHEYAVRSLERNIERKLQAGEVAIIAPAKLSGIQNTAWP